VIREVNGDADFLLITGALIKHDPMIACAG
jgi:hypothetical protein